MQIATYRLPLPVIDYTVRTFTIALLSTTYKCHHYLGHVITPALPQVYHMTPKGLNFLHAKLH